MCCYSPCSLFIYFLSVIFLFAQSVTLIQGTSFGVCRISFIQVHNNAKVMAIGEAMCLSVMMIKKYRMLFICWNESCLNVVYYRMEVSVIRGAIYFCGFSNRLCELSSLIDGFLHLSCLWAFGYHLTPEKIVFSLLSYNNKQFSKKALWIRPCKICKKVWCSSVGYLDS